MRAFPNSVSITVPLVRMFRRTKFLFAMFSSFHGLMGVRSLTFMNPAVNIPMAKASLTISYTVDMAAMALRGPCACAWALCTRVCCVKVVSVFWWTGDAIQRLGGSEGGSGGRERRCVGEQMWGGRKPSHQGFEEVKKEKKKDSLLVCTCPENGKRLGRGWGARSRAAQRGQDAFDASTFGDLRSRFIFRFRRTMRVMNIRDM